MPNPCRHPNTHRGHRIVRGELDSLRWHYSDTGELVELNPNRPCGHCGKANTPEGHDGCLGTLPGARNACCGHGRTSAAYIQFEDGTRLEGEEALVFSAMGKAGRL